MANVYFLAALLAATPVLAQDPNAVSQRDIDQAIRKGAENLKSAPSTGSWLHANCDELILLTLIVAGVQETNPRFKELLSHCLQAPLEKTYKVALLAMALEELDAEQYQMKIAQCAAFLVDNQAKNGQWSYGAPVDLKNYPYVEREKSVASGPKPGGARDFGGAKERKKPSKSIAVPQTKTTGEKGDNSNSQYAALGLRACFDAGITFEEAVVVRATKWWIESQHAPEDGGDKNAVASGGDARPRGWGYKGAGDGKAYGSMTAGAVGGVVIYDYMLKKDWKKNPIANAGMSWLNVKWSVDNNPERGGEWHYYYLYGLERAGILYDTTLIGKHDWYMEGAKLLLDGQDAGGSWKNQTWDTCFAILFLKKATRPLVATGGGK